MRITIVQGAFLPAPPVLGGAVEKMWFLLAAIFAEKGHSVLYVSRQYKDFPARETAGNPRHLRVRGYDMPGNLAVLKALDFLYSLRVFHSLPPADIIVTNTFWLPILLRSREKGAVYVDMARMPKGQTRFYRRAARLRVNSAAVERAVRRECQEAGRLARVIPNPLPFHPREPVPEKKENRLLYAGRIHPEKGIELLLKAFHQMAGREKTQWELRLAGPWETRRGGGGEAWKKRLERQYAHPDITWTGLLSGENQLNQEYKKAAVFLYPSLAEKGESFGLAPLEAMAWGCVPVVSGLDCFRDFISHGINGLVFSHRDKDAASQLARSVSHLIRDSGLRRALAAEAAKARQTHAPEKIAGLFLEDFARLTGFKPTAARTAKEPLAIP